MGPIKLLLSFFQVVLVILYIAFYNFQYFYSLYGTVQTLVSAIVK